ncbi:MAG: BMP family ABC transporter substrate-binding protein [Clostridia bacterium]|nr:BMP family ABC transporter substrate-binding protein [Clostridia bacterium]
MKKFLAILLAAIMALSLCSAFADDIAYDDIPDEMTSDNGQYRIAFVTDVGQLKDHSFNEGIYNGVKKYAYEHNITYKYYQPANGDQATDDDRYDAMKAAVDGGAEIVVCAGFMAGSAIEKASAEFENVKWVYVDGGAFGANTVGVAFKEEQCGFFAGYACVKDGYTKLGFAGGGGGTTPACCRYGYGFVQGAQAAAAELGVQVEMLYSWLYGGSFSASPELETMLNGWYENGTEVIFPCGGAMYLSCFSAAAANEAWALGVDSDQAGDSEWVLTSPLKGVDAASYLILGKYFDGQWDEVGGTSQIFGTAEGAIALPTAAESWRFSKFTVEEYNKMVEDVISGALVIDDDYANMKTEYDNLKITMVK